MDKQIFSKVILNNKYINSIIFNYVSEISLIFNRGKHYKWNDLIENPNLLAANNYLDLLKQWFKKRDDYLSWWDNKDGHTMIGLLQNVMMSGGIDMMTFLIEQFKDRQPKFTLNSLLESACRFNRIDLIRYLLSEYSLFKWDYYSAMVFAPYSKNMEILEMMVDLYNATSIAQDNSYVESKTSSTKNVFNSAAFVGSVQMIEYLCKERLEDLQHSDLYRMAIDAGQVETVRYLIANFSHLKDVDKCKSSSGTVRLPLDFALTKKNTDITIMLIEANCKTNFTNILGTVANYYGDCKLMDYLYSRGHRLESYPLDDVTMFDSILWLDHMVVNLLLQ
ncbi:hypothetical protein PPL_05394 [Heterostelium album PN500]|uniref:Ankyrin repeat protein n=1 Tax=Heterostelium pallidum (strain ATCC 26659 / Pp 5 / PN500) TaxID=670386 RepID=D3BA22_HETP5|nr:hypothetical protein PPL_05394 [Heterostelium album PN500]EFA81409.1 hypothetical protein PPL_05394 [Heterostelium album PN500]|eukprot:XP_020433527.1 hypothetical protein PPL_05394 [Heterostelium album PN500]